MKFIIALVLVSFFGLTAHAQGEPPTSTPAAGKMDDGADRDPAKAKSKKKKKKHGKKKKSADM